MSRILRLFAAVFALMALADPAIAEEAVTRPAHPDVGAHDTRVRMNPNAAPWRAVGKLQATSGGLHEFCTGTLIGPETVLTAAHCVFNLKTRHNFLPESLHFLIGYNGDDYAGHAVGVRMVIGPGYDPLHPQRRLSSDWALLTINTRLGTPDRVLPLRDKPPSLDTHVMIGGYGQDHPLVLMADPNCRITGRAADDHGGQLLVGNCAGARGVSGGPVLVADGKNWAVGGLYLASLVGAQGGIMVPLTDAQAQLERTDTIQK